MSSQRRLPEVPVTSCFSRRLSVISRFDPGCFQTAACARTQRSIKGLLCCDLSRSSWLWNSMAHYSMCLGGQSKIVEESGQDGRVGDSELTSSCRHTKLTAIWEQLSMRTTREGVQKRFPQLKTQRRNQQYEQEEQTHSVVRTHPPGLVGHKWEGMSQSQEVLPKEQRVQAYKGWSLGSLYTRKTSPRTSGFENQGTYVQRASEFQSPDS